MRMNRRAFLKAMGGMAASLYLAACSGEKRLTPTPDVPNTPVTNQPGPPSSTVAVVKAETYDRRLVRQQVQAALNAIGGIGDIVKAGASIAIKVNLTGGNCCPAPHSVPRSDSYWTHPEVVAVMGFDPTAEYPSRPFLRGDDHLNIAQSLGLGTNRLDEIEIKGISSLDEVRQNFASS